MANSIPLYAHPNSCAEVDHFLLHTPGIRGTLSASKTCLVIPVLGVTALLCSLKIGFWARWC
ncbi:hypothetical protein IAD21_05060 [Abditibacteriota bacterium]|nr:hypothetical protein IAD21_05060 [Abditibacteriota bacterium]